MSDSKQNIKTSRFKIIQIPKMVDERGSLCVVNGDEDFPFEVKRVFWILAYRLASVVESMPIKRALKW